MRDNSNLFADQEAADRTQRAEARQRAHWQRMGWGGPEVGGYGDVATPVVDRVGEGKLYAYMERVRFIEQQADGRWVAEIDMGNIDGQPWFKNGARLLLGIGDIDPPVFMAALVRAGRAS